ncbi:hypothetical protein M0R45_036030 [Rubus argutus]|uniref:Uncharacterized protein n=1 Tax=Rubus argutus TaxID=59490 RepID=A0AAW1VZE0_RUBAR
MHLSVGAGGSRWRREQGSSDGAGADAAWQLWVKGDVIWRRRQWTGHIFVGLGDVAMMTVSQIYGLPAWAGCDGDGGTAARARSVVELMLGWNKKIIWNMRGCHCYGLELKLEQRKSFHGLMDVSGVEEPVGVIWNWR